MMEAGRPRPAGRASPSSIVKSLSFPALRVQFSVGAWGHEVPGFAVGSWRHG